VWLADTLGFGMAEDNHLIESFVSHYRAEWNKYARMADLAKDLFQQNAKMHELDPQPLCMSRAKTPESLRQKLYYRNKMVNLGKGYIDKMELPWDISDLAGVRIAIYFPNQMGEVEQIINQTFDKVRKKPSKDDRGTGHLSTPLDQRCYSKVGKYTGQIYQVQVKIEEVGQLYLTTDSDVVEIQVVSVLVHAWAEVEHKRYKRLIDGSTPEEDGILDDLNSLVLSGEHLLTRLHDLRNARSKPFERLHNLSGFLADRIPKEYFLEERGTHSLDEVDRDELLGPSIGILFKFLKKTKHDTPTTLGQTLKQLGFHDRQAGKLNEYSVRFQPLKPMSVVFIIWHVLATEWQMGLPAELQESERKNYPRRCKILISAIIWLTELFSRENWGALSAKLDQEIGGHGEGLEWVYQGSDCEAVLNGMQPSEQDKRCMDILWDWFDRQTDSALVLVFKIARMGVLEKLPENLDKLGRLRERRGDSHNPGLAIPIPPARQNSRRSLPLVRLIEDEP
jgi:ppGpp synthetase/RelA/SpoT-type nucleotidyltranferase